MSEGNGTTTGYVKWYNDTKGYGFIRGSGNADIFVHANELKACGIMRPLKEGEQVSFISEKRPKGLFATKLALVNS